MPDKDRLVIWPIYFDAQRSRKDGRMVPIEDAVSDPNLDMIITAALKSGFKPEIERDKKHPKIWHLDERSGRILLAKKGGKSEALKRIAASLKMKYRKKGR